MAKRLIHVTQEDIDKAKEILKDPLGVRGSRSEVCPIAQAIKRTFGNDDVTVLPGMAWIGEGDDPFILPYRAGDFISDFDKDKPVEPFKFYLKPASDNV